MSAPTPSSSPSPSLALSAREQREHHELGARIAGLEIRDFTPPECHHVILLGRRFHYLDWGSPSRPTVLFLHGGGQTARTWDLVCLALRGEFHCLALDQRGHGDSEWSYELDYRIESHVGDVEAFADHLALERFALVGMSMGCINSILYAIRNPERVAALVAVDAGPWVRSEGGRRIAEFVRETAVLPSLEAHIERAVRFNPRRDPRLLRRSLLHNLRRLPDGSWMRKNDQRLAFDQRIGELDVQIQALAEQLDRITCPTLVLRGADSDIFLDEHAERFANALPDGRWRRVPDAGHNVQGDNPRALLKVLRPFLSRGHCDPAA